MPRITCLQNVPKVMRPRHLRVSDFKWDKNSQDPTPWNQSRYQLGSTPLTAQIDRDAVHQIGVAFRAVSKCQAQ